MAEFTVKYKSEDRLHLVKNPSSKSISIFVALISFAFAAVIYGNDSLLFEAVYFIGAFFIGVSVLGDWEECIFDHVEGRCWLRKTTFLQQFHLNHYINLPIFRKDTGMSFPLKGIINVIITDTFKNPSCNKYRIELLMASGIKLPISEQWKSSNRCHCETLCQVLKKFLHFDRIEQLNRNYFDNDDSSSYESASTNSNSDSSGSESLNGDPQTRSDSPWLNRDRLVSLTV